MVSVGACEYMWQAIRTNIIYGIMQLIHAADSRHHRQSWWYWPLSSKQPIHSWEAVDLFWRNVMKKCVSALCLMNSASESVCFCVWSVTFNGWLTRCAGFTGTAHLYQNTCFNIFGEIWFVVRNWYQQCHCLFAEKKTTAVTPILMFCIKTELLTYYDVCIFTIAALKMHLFFIIFHCLYSMLKS